MNEGQLREHIIWPVLEDMGLASESAVELLILTAATESHMGKYIKQVRGPALGIYQMEPQSHDDVWENFLHYKADLSAKVRKWELEQAFPYDNSYQMAGNLYYATAMARVFYLRFDKRLPDHNDIEGLAQYWKKYWNTPLGAGTVEKAINDYNKYVGNL